MVVLKLLVYLYSKICIWISKLIHYSFTEANPPRSLMLGLDGAGKTTILYRLKFNDDVRNIPKNIAGFVPDTVTISSEVSFTVWDVRGHKRIRHVWRHYYHNAEGLIFVVDSSDRERMVEVEEELFGVLNSDELPKGIPVVVIANKQDLPLAMKTSDIAGILDLQKIKDRKWHIQGACATSGNGTYESFCEMSNLVREYKKNRVEIRETI